MQETGPNAIQSPRFEAEKTKSPIQMHIGRAERRVRGTTEAA